MTTLAENPIDLTATAAGLTPWRSLALGKVGPACVKVLRMDGLPLVEERHDTTEALLVLDGRLELLVAGRPLTVNAGELHLVPAGTAHAVRPGSSGTLVIVEVEEDGS
ncbi:cupin domain-containing protein [Streptomyces sp. NPDC056670]|uniref:cupin domain-containing protein n=1 Tax=Streptomyces sp. NPDC056670 TaxID=3345904 RepID=UPI0036C84549